MSFTVQDGIELLESILEQSEEKEHSIFAINEDGKEKIRHLIKYLKK